MEPLGLLADSAASAMAEGTAARVASFLTLVAAGPIAWLYSTKASQAAEGNGEVAAIPVADDEVEPAEAAALAGGTTKPPGVFCGLGVLPLPPLIPYLLVE